VDFARAVKPPYGGELAERERDVRKREETLCLNDLSVGRQIKGTNGKVRWGNNGVKENEHEVSSRGCSAE